ncbi:MAG: ornithine carbamoyltransferase [Planctomycetota bacterium]|nr:ornithine carbamoyltransferase [Pirellulales bacterium]MDA0256025.1 ornithine carbamoyltransferase [Planctomycetota bacterium]MDA1202416.1 ornithine carbamoyltransferase [Planctomycetota bacterium]
MRHLIVAEDLTAAEIEAIFAISRDLQEKYAAGRRDALLPGRVLALVFEKPSLRTRVSFEAAMTHLGGSSLFLGQDSGFASSRESIADFGRVLGGYVDAIVCRSKSHETIERLADVAGVPVINGLSDMAHPCQALADIYTLRQEIGRVKGMTLTFVGDGNNVARSLAVVCGLLGMRFVLAAPEGYHFDPAFRRHLAEILPEAEVEETTDAAAAVTDAAAVYTDVWASMGQEQERAERQKAFASFQVNEALMARCPDAVFMHCLPARRGEEVTDGVIDGPKSIVLPQATNRMHLQKGLLAWLLGHAE